MSKNKADDFSFELYWLISFAFVGGILWGSGLPLEQMLFITGFIGAPYSLSANFTFFLLYFGSVGAVRILLQIVAWVVAWFIPRRLRLFV